MKILFISNFIFLQRVQAMNMFQAEVRSPWIYDHCWEVLKYCDKWMIIPQNNPRPRSLVMRELMKHLYLLTRIKIHIAMQQLALQGRDPREEKQLKKADIKVRRVQQILVILFQIRFVKYLSRVKRERIFMRSKSFNY